MTEKLSNSSEHQELIEIDPDTDRPSSIAGRIADIDAAVPGFDFRVMPALVEAAKFMAQSRQGVPAPFRVQPGLCLAVATQAHQWRFNPYGLAQCAHVIKDQVAYEAKAIKAALDAAGVLVEPMDFHFAGEGDQLVCTATGTFLNRLGEKTVRELESPPVGIIHPKNSPLWTTDVKQQLRYYTSRAWARIYAPAVMMGVYSVDEVAGIEQERPVRESQGGFAQELAAATGRDLSATVVETGPGVDIEVNPEPEPGHEEVGGVGVGHGTTHEQGEDQAPEQGREISGSPEDRQEQPEGKPLDVQSSDPREAGVATAQQLVEALKASQTLDGFDALVQGAAIDGRIDKITAAGTDVLDRFNLRVDEIRHQVEDLEAEKV